MRIKILLAIRQFGLGGAEARMNYLFENLVDNENFLVKKTSLVGFDQVYGAEGSYNKSKISRFIKYFKEIKTFKPQIIHAFDISTAVYSKLVVMILGLNTRIISGMGSGRVSGKMARFSLKSSILQPDIYICNSYAGANAIKVELTKNIPVEVIQNGIILNKFSYPIEIPKILQIVNLKDRFVIGYIGKLDNNKFGQRVVEIARLFENDLIKPLFIIIGNGPYKADLDLQIEQSEYLITNVKALGLQAEAYKFIPFFNVGILCSDTEGFPNVILEYMLCGKPTISTSVGDVGLVIEDYKSGILLGKYDPHLFKEKILELMTDDFLYRKLSTSAKERVINHFAIELMIKKYSELYLKLIK
jgi:glycosyltransferase involved in cell wall biosynthesis